MEYSNQAPHKILLKFEEVDIDREEHCKFLIACRDGKPQTKFPIHCVECFHVIPHDKPHFRRLPCCCRIHSLCLLRVMKREGVTLSGTFPCKQCISRELSRGISSQCSI